MIKHLFVFLLASTAFAGISSLPNEFYVAERLLALTSTFDIATNADPIGTARRHFLSLMPIYDLEDDKSNPIATAKARFFSWGTLADVNDEEGRKIGCIEENLRRIFPWAQYRVFNAENKLVAIATMNFCGTYFTLHDPHFPEQVFATVSRPLIRFFRDAWTVQIVDDRIFTLGQIDPRLLIFLAIYQTDKENRARFYAEFSHQIQEQINAHEGNR